MPNLSKLAWEAQRSGAKGERGLAELQRAARSQYGEQFAEAQIKASKRARRTGRTVYIVFAPTMHRAVVRGPRSVLAESTRRFWRENLWPFVLTTNLHQTRATAPIIWSTSHGSHVHSLAGERRARNVRQGMARDRVRRRRR